MNNQILQKYRRYSLKSIGILALLMLSLFLVTQPVSVTASTTSSSSLSPSQVSSPEAKVINTNPSYPGINQNVAVTADVISPAGVDTAQVDLIYTYTSLGGLTTTADMAPDTTSLTPNSFDSITTLETNQKGVNFTYVSDYIDNVEITINSVGGNTDFVYSEWAYYDLATSEWVGSTPDTSTRDTITFSYSGVMGGFSFYAIVQRGNDGGGQTPADPEMDVSSVIESTRQFTATIAAPGEATDIDYYIRAVDLDGTEFFSNNYTIYANSKPTLVSLNDLPTEMGGDNELYINATIRDADGRETLERVSAYYRMESQLDWQRTQLTEGMAINSSDVLFSGTLNLTALSGYEENMEIYLNMTDSVAGVEQPSTSSQTFTLFRDSRGPTLDTISVFADPIINNATRVNSSISLTMDFIDANGVENVDIIYEINTNGTVFTDSPMNSSVLQQSDTTEEFTYDFAGLSFNAEIAYYFETTDFLGNTYATELNYIYVDAEGPRILDQSSAPLYPSNTSDAIIVYNVGDASGVADQEFYYRDVNETTWNTAGISEINYAQNIDQEETIEQSPSGQGNIGNIRDNNITEFEIDVTPSISPDEVIVDLEFTHSRTTDLRIYMIYRNNSYLVFDRGTASSVSFSLGDYFSTYSLGLENVTIQVHDLVEDFTGVMDLISFHIIDYTVPAGFTYEVTIPSYDKETTVFYYWTLTDNLGNIANSSVYSIYFDGSAPRILNFTEYSGEVDAQGASALDVEVHIEEEGTLDTVELYYRYSNNSSWNILSMDYRNNTMYAYDQGLPLLGTNGTVYYQIRIFDKVGFSVNTTTIGFDYFDANAPAVRLVTDISEVFDLTDTDTLRLEVEVSDDLEVASVILIYQINDDDQQRVSMAKAPNGNYIYDIVVTSSEGNIEFRIIATDSDGISTETENFSLQYINADVFNIQDYLPFIIGALVVLVVGGIGYALWRKYQGASGVPSVFTKKPATLESDLDNPDWDEDWDSEDW